jgi:U3 small nucleolar RNA-associated protein MPP10
MTDTAVDLVPMETSSQSPPPLLQKFISLLEDAPLEDLGISCCLAASIEGVSPSSLLRETSAALFTHLEDLSRLHGTVNMSPKNQNGDEMYDETLSGLPELYIKVNMGSDDADDAVLDAETIWGQVELQNTALLKRLSRSIRQLITAAADNSQEIRLLHPDSLPDDDPSESDSRSSDDNDDDGEVGKVSEEEEEANEETRRMRRRMELSMEDMDDEDVDIDDDDSTEHEPKPSSSIRPSTSRDDNDWEQDPTTVQMHDGFFNLHEMEAFADEEEEYLPSEAFGPVRPETKRSVDARTFHQKQRDGDVLTHDESENDDDDGDDENLLFRKNDDNMPRRRKYRDDDEIGALLHLYEAPRNEDDDGDDAIHMTAADLFGPPNRKYVKLRGGFQSKPEEDKTSWNNFDESKKERRNDNKIAGWNEDPLDGQTDSDSESDDKDSGEEENGLSEDEEEEVPMKGAHSVVRSQPTKQMEKLIVQTEQLEQDMLAEKPWQMKGETGSSSRPVNSLLESTPEFEVATKMAPTITVEHTADLEETIKKRILTEDWDDVVPRELPDVGWYKKKGELPEVSQEKAKLGLGELYEREYLKKAIGYDVDAAEKLSAEDKVKNEMKSLFANLCSKLDALSNYHFAPRPMAADTEVRPITVPAIAMEEVLPIHVSDARGVAPEEVYNPKRGREAVLRSESELEPEDRKRLRSGKKAARRKARQAKLADEKLLSRLEPGLGLNNPYEKRKMREELSMARADGRVTTGSVDAQDHYGTSTTFFQRMQQVTKQTIRDGKEASSETDSRRLTVQRSKSSALKL